jgi:hypothetical protein
VNPAADTAAICESFGYEAFIVQRGEKIAALPATAGECGRAVRCL